jgi:hypothetical protein
MAMLYTGMGVLACPAGYSVEDWSVDPTNPANPLYPSFHTPGPDPTAGQMADMVGMSCKDAQGKSYKQYLLTTPAGMAWTAEIKRAEQAIETKSMLLWAGTGAIALLAPGAAKLLAVPVGYMAMMSMQRGH